MTSDRPAIPADLERALFAESGYRCAVPACGVTSPLQVEHIVPWAQVQEHAFENMIVLCANHHGQKKIGGGPRQLDQKALRTIKHNLARLNGRFGDVERRVLDYFVENAEEESLKLPGHMEVLLMRLISDGLLDGPEMAGGMALGDKVLMRNDKYTLTDAGREVVAQLRDAMSLD
ncbi:HNH endonuclease [Aeromicrobium choanae]|uniref:HNH endonuclease n=1 Tax=Aeromicrobium choanae TaxID=1736691 RepID=UPI0012946D06|nr:HNH endonuclease signature motif containing protein [Aeromicrobium choanae]